MDVDSISPGTDFIEAIKESVGASEMLIALIGKRWVTSSDEDGIRRLDNPNDFVRTEIVTALKNKVLVIPILVDGASMPKSEELPEDLKALVSRNAIEIRNARFSADSESLITTVKGHLKSSPLRKRQRQVVQIALLLMALVLASGVGFYYLKLYFKEQSLRNFFSATAKERPWENSLGMKFVPVNRTDVLFSEWDSRVKDFNDFVAQSHYDAGSGWKEPEFPKNNGFKQSPTDPVVNVSWIDASEFCIWLTKKEHGSGRLPDGLLYRLPTDEEWSFAVGLGQEVGATPAEKSEQVNVFPWGTEWPPPKGAGNYCGEESKVWSDSIIAGFRDDYLYTSPVGSFPANKFGLFDMGGNVWQWCEDRFSAQNQERVLRGACWNNGPPAGIFSSSFRFHIGPGLRFNFAGFRCVIAREVRQ
jgi:formylglycine-generating enzyme required for sulfatase activity